MNRNFFVLGISAIGLGLSLLAGADDSHSNPTRLQFIDDCTGEVSTTSSPNGLHLEIDIEGLDRTRPFYFDLQMGPAYLLDKAALDEKGPRYTHHIKHTYYPKLSKRARLAHGSSEARSIEDAVSESGHFHMRKKVRIKVPTDHLLDEPERRVWTARLRWTQVSKDPSQESKYGSAVASVYAMNSPSESFFLRLDQPTCFWDSPIEIHSKYHYNSLEGPMELARETRLFDHYGDTTGVGLGFLPTQNFGGFNLSSASSPMTPLLASPGPLPGGLSAWFFRGWHRVSAMKTSTWVQRSWTLNRDQGGYFGIRYRFTRFPVEEYILKPKRWGRCARWVRNQTGYLDVGSPQTDFYVVPFSHSGSSSRSSEFMEKMSPGLNTCSAMNLSEDQGKFQVSDSGDELMFFYPDEFVVNK
jgi:hypothetical protein